MNKKRYKRTIVKEVAPTEKKLSSRPIFCVTALRGRMERRIAINSLSPSRLEILSPLCGPSAALVEWLSLGESTYGNVRRNGSGGGKGEGEGGRREGKVGERRGRSVNA